MSESLTISDFPENALDISQLLIPILFKVLQVGQNHVKVTITAICLIYCLIVNFNIEKRSTLSKREYSNSAFSAPFHRDGSKWTLVKPFHPYLTYLHLLMGITGQYKLCL